MEEPAVDGLAPTLAEPYSRRALSRLLGGLAVDGSLAQAGTEHPAPLQTIHERAC